MTARLFLDYETHYEPAGDYSLQKMPTWQYIRDARFQVLGAAIAAPGFIPPQWYTSLDDIREALARLPWGEGVELVAHNAAFDGAILHHTMPGYRPRRYYCTKLAARYLIAQGTLPPSQGTSLRDFAPEKGDTAAAVAAGGAELATYAMGDLTALVRLFVGQQTEKIPARELDLIDLHTRMAAEPCLEVDTHSLCREANKLPPPEAVVVRKKAVFIAALSRYGVEPEYKTSPRTGKPTEAFAKTDPFMRALAHHRDPRVRVLRALRTQGGSNIDRTRAQRLLDVGAPLPVPLLYYGAHTGRASGQDKMNLQNLKRGGTLRSAIRAPKGWSLVVVDSAQIEVRVLAWLANEPRLLAPFVEGRDVYTDYAALVMFHKPHAEITKEERRLSKPPVLAAGFGQGWRGLVGYASSMGVELTEGMAQRAVEGYRAAYPRVVAYWHEVMRGIEQHGQTTLPSGRLITYPDLTREGRDVYFLRHGIFSKQRKGVRDRIKLWHGLAVENGVQATARDVVMEQTLALSHKWRVVLSAHDEAVLCVPQDRAEEARQDALTTFATPPAWAYGLPLAGEAIVTDNYGEKP